MILTMALEISLQRGKKFHLFISLDAALVLVLKFPLEIVASSRNSAVRRYCSGKRDLKDSWKNGVSTTGPIFRFSSAFFIIAKAS